MTHAEVQTVPLCMRAVPEGLPTTREMRAAYVVLRRMMLGAYRPHAELIALNDAAGVLDDVLSMQEG